MVHDFSCVKEGDYSFVAVADYGDLVAESNELNNVAQEVKIKCVKSSSAKPDFSVADSYYRDGVYLVKEGTTVNVVETTWNIGTASAGPSTTLVSLPPRYSDSRESQVLFNQKPSLVVDQGYENQSYFYCTPGKIFSISAFADYANNIEELNEKNNEEEIRVKCAREVCSACGASSAPSQCPVGQVYSRACINRSMKKCCLVS